MLMKIKTYGIKVRNSNSFYFRENVSRWLEKISTGIHNVLVLMTN